MSSILYVASQSASRKQLLEQAGIPHQTIKQHSDEQVDTSGLDFYGHVQAIAHHKMEHAELPSHEEVGTDELFVLTADSLVRALKTGELFGKPRDAEHAKYMLRTFYGDKLEVVTGCCLEKRHWNGNEWQLVDHHYWTTDAVIQFWVAEEELDAYLAKYPAVFHSAGAGILEAGGQVYCKSLQGSYTAALGLPLYELRQALIKIGFYY